MTSERIITYEPEHSLKKGYRASFKEIVSEISNNRWLIFQLFKRDFLALYKQSVFGILWAVILPLVSVGVFVILRTSGIFSVGEVTVPYPIYAVFGLAFWQLFSTGLLASSNSLANAGPMMTQINFSRLALVIAATGQSLVAFLIQLLVLVLLFAFYRFVPSIGIVLIPLFIVPILALTLGLGFLFSLLNSVFRDVANLLTVAVTFLLFLTPVLYASPPSGAVELISTYNPLYYLISFPRSVILTGTASEWRGYGIAASLSFVLLIICILIFHVTEKRIAERV